MATDVIVGLFPQVVSAASNIQIWGSMWYQASTDFIEFQIDLRRLRGLQDLWFEESRKYGGLLDDALADNLNEAASILKGAASLFLLEVERLKSKEESKGTFCACLTDCWGKLCLLTFPTAVKARIKLVADTFENISSSLQSNQDIRTLLERMVLSRTYSSAFTFSNDDRYVSFEDSEFKVHSALKNRKAVVLLHGGPGQGKSTLARHVALHYKGRRSAQEGTDGTALFDQVVYLECGPELDISNKQLELLQQLGLNTTVLQEPGHSTTDHDLKLSNLLRGVLKDKRILVILDDVWKVEFLQQMIDLCGSHVKCLVTSQRGDLCRRLNCSALEEISIQDIPRTVARRILASHVGFPNQQIPDGLIMGEADKIIQETGGNPLALASVAAAIPRNRAYDITEWKNMSKRFLQLLKTEDTALIQSKKYPKSFWSAMQFSVESLTEDAQKKKFMEEAKSMRDLKKSMTESLMGLDVVGSIDSMETDTDSKSMPDEETVVRLAFCALYLDKQLAKKAASKIGIPYDNCTNLKRNAIEPVSRLMMQLDNDSETISIKFSARQIFLRYTCDGVLHDDGVAHLLASPISIRPMLQALTRITLVARTTLTEIRPGRWLEKLIGLLSKDENPHFQEGAAVALADLASQNMETTLKIIDFPATVKHLSKLLSADKNTYLQLAAVGALYNLISTGDDDSRKIVLNFPMMLEKLVDLLSTDSHPRLQQWAVRTLDLSTLVGDKTTSRILEALGVSDYLSKFLSLDRDVDLQLVAVKALANLTTQGGFDSQMSIIQFKGKLEKPLDLLSKDTNPRLQELAARTLGYSALGGHEATSKILGSPSVLEHLSDFLSTDNVIDLQLASLGALFDLTWSGGLDSKRKIFEFPRLLEKLVGMLSNDIDPRVQLMAIGILGNAPAGRDEPSSKVLHSPGISNHLSNFLSVDRDVDLQLAAVKALANLTTRGRFDSHMSITQFKGKLEKPLDLLSKDTNPRLQELAARTLGYSALGGHEATSEVLDSPNVLEHLSGFLSTHVIDLQLASLGALYNMTWSGGLDSKRKIFEFPGMLEKLVDMLSNDINPRVQLMAVRILGNAPVGPDELSSKLLHSPGILNHLSNFLCVERNVDLQLAAVQALATLTTKGGFHSQMSIIQFKGKLEKPLDLLSKDTNPRLQELAARTLGYSALGGPEATSKILGSPNVLEHLSDFLSTDRGIDLQLAALWALNDLSWCGDLDSKKKIFHFPGMLDKMMDKLSNNTNLYFQVSALRFLENSALGGDEISSEIIDSPAVLDHLSNFLSIHNDYDLQLAAIGALAALNWKGGMHSKKKIFQYPGMLENVLDLLAKDTNPRLQELATRILGDIALGGEAATSRILDSPKVLEHLSDFLSADKGIDLPLAAVGALGDLSWSGGLDSKKKIFHFPQLLDKIMDKLSNNTNLQFQVVALRFLENSALGGEEISSEIIDSPGVLDHLFNFLSIDNDYDLQLAAIGALATVNWKGGVHSKMKIFQYPGMLENVVDLLAKDTKPRLQELAARSVGDIALGGQAATSKILDSPKVLEHLSDCLSADKGIDLRLTALGALVDMSWSGGLDSRKKIFHFPGMLDKIMDKLSNNTNLHFQVLTLRFLENSALGGEEISSEIIDSPGVLDHLFNFLSIDNDYDLQLAAIRALAALNWKGGMHSKKKIFQYPGMLENVLDLLAKDTKPRLQELAARNVADIALGGQAATSKILDSPKVLEYLSDCLSADKGIDLQLTALGALGDLSWSGGLDSRKKIFHFPGMLDKMMDKLSNNTNLLFQVLTLRFLENSALGGEEISSEIIDSPGVLDHLSNFLSIDNDFDLQLAAIGAVATLTWKGGMDSRNKIFRYPGMLEKVLHLLSKDINPRLQEWAARTLGHEALGGHEATSKILGSPNVLEHLSDCLSTDKGIDLQLAALGALDALSWSGGLDSKNKIFHFPGMLDKMMDKLSKNTNVHFQVFALRFMKNSALGGEETSSEIIGFPGVFDRLLNFLSMDQDVDVQLAAMGALTALTSKGGIDSKKKIFQYPGMLEKVLDLLAKDTHPRLQELAVRTLGYSALGGHEGTSKILGFPNVLKHLSDFLSTDNVTDLQLASLGALYDLSWSGGLDCKKKIFHFPGMLDKMMDKLSNNTNLHFQVLALRFLENSALGGEEISSEIIDSPGVLDHLSNFLSIDNDYDLQLAAIGALATLNWKGGMHSKKRIFQFPGMLEKVLHLLAKDINPRLQELAARSLGSSALGGPEATFKILDSPNVLEHLSDFLSNDKGIDLQLASLGALDVLSWSGGMNYKKKIFQYPGMLEKVLDLLYRGRNSRLQKLAARTLGK